MLWTALLLRMMIVLLFYERGDWGYVEKVAVIRVVQSYKASLHADTWRHMANYWTETCWFLVVSSPFWSMPIHCMQQVH
jgi:hypothetical protein